MTINLNDLDLIQTIRTVSSAIKDQKLIIDEVCLGKDGIEVVYDNRSDWAVINLNGEVEIMSKMGSHPELTWRVL